MRRARAFSLVELLIVIAVVAILLALVGPSMADLLATQRVRNINAQLVTDLQFARSEAVRRKEEVKVWLQDPGSMTCYVLTEVTVLGNCNCANAPGAVCDSGRREFRTVQIPTSLGVRVTPTAGPGAPDMNFSHNDGRLTVPVAGEFQVDVVSSRRGHLRTTVGRSGRPSVCSPDGSIGQVPRC